MDGREIPDLKDGDELSATWLNAVRDLCRSAQVSLSGHGLVGVVGPGGTALALRRDPSCWAKIISTASGASYNVREQVPLSGGAWQDGRDLVAAESNGTTDLSAGRVVWCQYSPSGDSFSFQMGTCS